MHSWSVKNGGRGIEVGILDEDGGCGWRYKMHEGFLTLASVIESYWNTYNHNWATDESGDRLYESQVKIWVNTHLMFQLHVEVGVSRLSDADAFHGNAAVDKFPESLLTLNEICERGFRLAS